MIASLCRRVRIRHHLQYQRAHQVDQILPLLRGHRDRRTVRWEQVFLHRHCSSSHRRIAPPSVASPRRRMHRRRRAMPTKPAWATPAHRAPRTPRRKGWSSIRGDKRGSRPADGSSNTSVPGNLVRPQPRPGRRLGGETGSEPSSARRDTHQYVAGPAGIGKSWIACALAHGACRNGYSAAYRRLTRLLTELSIARADGRYPKLLASLAKTHVLVIDDFGLARLTAENRRDLLEIIEDRHALRSTIVTSQFPVEKWHAVVGDPTFADAILDRLVHRAYQLNLKGKSMRKRRNALTQTDHQSS